MARRQISTDRQVMALKPGEKDYEIGIADSRGLTVRVYKTGAKVFELRYVSTSGARRRLTLGAYPDLSLAEARAKAGSHRVEVIEGADPAADRIAAKEIARTGETLNELAEAYWKAATRGLHGGRKRPKRASTIDTERRWWRNHVEAKLGRRRFRELKRADIRAFMTELTLESGLAANSLASVGAIVQAVLGYAVHEDRLEGNPALGLARPLATTSRDRMFSDQALAVIWRAASVAAAPRSPFEDSEDIHARMVPEMGLAIRLLILSLTRRSEVAGARWPEFDLDAGLWTIPAGRAKAQHLHVVPITDAIRDVLLEAKRLHPHSMFVFPALKGMADHLDPHAITRAFARICARKKLSLGSPHDIRRTGATTLIGRYGVTRLVVGYLLGHTAKEGAWVTGIYDRHSYLPEKRAALDLWARHLEGLESRTGAHIVEASPVRLLTHQTV
ncbi:integrase arm-type DNA-binding domain-containing protein [Brevundimonas sp.]|uniref:tyrosine-type recombinase/integrase n=1 Tax=Brevundimonas sp. TaxID=1871086 RepID=UPI0028A9891D|nr:integrase arm-type DNA-binding domain-containing protein [Brevundimonas sp.]